jgi:Tfp pilus assembly protein FimT
MTFASRVAQRVPRQCRRPASAADLAARERQSGASLLELVTVMAILIVLAAAAIPYMAAYVHESQVRGAAFYLRGLFRQVRARAAAEARYVGVVFDEVDGAPVFSIYGDGNANGIRRADIAFGVEEKLREPYRLTDTFPGVRYGYLPKGASAPFFPGVQFGRSHIVSFSPLGSSTSGTLYLSSDYGFIYAVVVLGATGRVRVARYSGGRWQAE